ncbi:MAG: hypothetical protein MI922_00905, partial [Bacteroidales bacterium]|nr:hypothetical protein [Bacteroidales bacterium]
MKKSAIVLIVLFCSFSAWAQKISAVRFEQVERNIEIKYDILNTRYFHQFTIEIFVSTNGGKSYYGPLREVTGDVGSAVTGGKNRLVIWEVLKEIPDFGGEVVFDVRAKQMEYSKDTRYSCSYKGSYYAPIGIMLGVSGRRIGGYISFNTNQRNLQMDKATYKISRDFVENYDGKGYYSMTQTDIKQRMNITAGAIVPVGWNWSFYLGGGYSAYNLLWKINEFDYNDVKIGEAWVKNTGESFTSGIAEVGTLFNFKRMVIGVGISSPGFRYLDGTFTVGYSF